VTIIAHRRNTLADLEATPVELGVEVDIRSRGDELVIHHDPFRDGEPFDPWIEAFRHGTLVLNVKEEGLERRLLEQLRERGIEDFFFLDQSFPFFLKTVTAGERRCAVRVSEHESIETALSLAGKADWVWVDSFSRFPLDRGGWMRLKEAGYRLCLVSPELVGRDPEPEIRALRETLDGWGVEPDAVCTKLERAPLWRAG
jgi:hypothetical protein